MSVLVSMVGDCVDVPEVKNTHAVPNLIEAVSSLINDYIQAKIKTLRYYALPFALLGS